MFVCMQMGLYLHFHKHTHNYKTIYAYKDILFHSKAFEQDKPVKALFACLNDSPFECAAGNVVGCYSYRVIL